MKSKSFTTYRVTLYYHLLVYVTVCDLEKSFSFDKTFEITSHVHFLIHVETYCSALFLELWDLERFKTAKVMFTVIGIGVIRQAIHDFY